MGGGKEVLGKFNLIPQILKSSTTFYDSKMIAVLGVLISLPSATIGKCPQMFSPHLDISHRGIPNPSILDIQTDRELFGFMTFKQSLVLTHPPNMVSFLGLLKKDVNFTKFASCC